MPIFMYIFCIFSHKNLLMNFNKLFIYTLIFIVVATKNFPFVNMTLRSRKNKLSMVPDRLEEEFSFKRKISFELKKI